jgi:hypothetical protein
VRGAGRLVGVFVVVAVAAAAEAVALLSGCEALAVELHALRVAAVAEFLLLRFVRTLSADHELKFKFKLYPAQDQAWGWLTHQGEACGGAGLGRSNRFGWWKWSLSRRLMGV